MTKESDILTTASSLVQKHGPFAEALAAIRHDELLEQGDNDGATVWAKIVKLVRVMLAAAGNEDSTIH